MQLPFLEKGTLIKRYKRFLADIELESGKIITVHCPNSGSMLKCNDPGSPVLISKSDNPNRKYPHTWELVQIYGTWVGINTSRTNKIVHEAIVQNQIPELAGYESIKPEVKYGQNSRIDLLLNKPNKLCYVEVKNVTLAYGDEAQFPDAVTARGTKHLNELMDMVKQGHRSVIFYLVQRNDCESFKPAAHIDPKYAETLLTAFENGVEILVYKADITPQNIKITNSLPYSLKID